MKRIIFVIDADGADSDIAAWLDAQINMSASIRDAIRAQIKLQHSGQETVIRDAVLQGMARLPDVVAAAVQSALAEYQLSPAGISREIGEEDPELAASLDQQLDSFL